MEQTTKIEFDLSAEINFYNKWLDFTYDYKNHKAELEDISQSPNPLFSLKTSSLNTFSFKLPDVDIEKIKLEAHQIINDPNSTWQYTHTMGYPNFKNWKIYYFYQAVGTSRRDTTKFNVDEYEFDFLYNGYPELTKLVNTYCNKKTTVFLSVLETNGIILIHSDNIGSNQNPNTLSKCRIPILYDKDACCLLEGTGKLNYYSDEIVFFNNRLPHAVYNYSNNLKIDLSLALKIEGETLEKVNNSIREKIAKILEND